jgi:hypothetical protein
MRNVHSCVPCPRLLGRLPFSCNKTTSDFIAVHYCRGGGHQLVIAYVHQCFIQTPRLRGGGMKGGEGEGAHRATFFACLQELLGNSEVLGEKVPPNRSG